jgi:hypothetical protein
MLYSTPAADCPDPSAGPERTRTRSSKLKTMSSTMNIPTSTMKLIR